MADVIVEVRLPTQLAARQSAGVDDIAIPNFPGFTPHAEGAVTVRASKHGPVAVVRGTADDPHALVGDPRVVAVWTASGRPLWDTPEDPQDRSRYTF